MKRFQSADADQLVQALQVADLRVLLMVLFHMTGDGKWLQPPYRPVRDVTLIADRNAGFDVHMQAQIRAAALNILLNADGPAVTDPGNALMTRMMAACMGEKVPAEYAGMMREEVGFVSRFARWKSEAGPKRLAARKLSVGIVGAGSAGIILGANLKALGIGHVIFERNGEVGGTWHRHRYPGCGVDTPNHAYSFSFGSRYGWSRYFAPREQIQDYMERIATETGVRDAIRFHSTVQRATWDAAARKWQVEVDGPGGIEHFEFDVFISAIGQLSDPWRMPVRGEESFTGDLLHPMEWPEGLEIDNRDVGIVGSGATSMQIVSAIAARVRSLTIYQRTPQWARPIPRYHDPIGGDEQWLLTHVPFYAEWFRLSMFWRYGDGLLPTLRKDPDWPQPERSVNAVNERHRIEMEKYIRSELEGRPDLLDKSIPAYPPYGKRILLDAGWYKAIKAPNVELVTEAIDRIEGGDVIAADGRRRPTDVLVVSTGYRVNDLTARLNVTGRDGVTLAETWGGDDPFAYLGCAVPGFPNLFIVYGPNTGLAHGGSAIFMNECAAHYVSEMIVAMVENDLETVEVRREICDAYTDRVNAEHEKLIWTAPGLSSYYRNAKGRVTSANPWRLVDYWSMTHEARLGDYVLGHLGEADGAASDAPQIPSAASAAG